MHMALLNIPIFYTAEIAYVKVAYVYVYLHSVIQLSTFQILLGYYLHHCTEI